MAPVASGITDREKDQFRLGLRPLESLRSPRIPIHGIVSVLEKVRRFLVNQPVRCELRRHMPRKTLFVRPGKTGSACRRKKALSRGSGSWLANVLAGSARASQSAEHYPFAPTR